MINEKNGLRTWALATAGFALAAFFVRWAELVVPLFPGIVSDPREVFVTLGAALTGPVGGALIGLAATLPQMGAGLNSTLSTVSHLVGGIGVGLLYWGWVNRAERLVGVLARWAVVIIVYYTVFLIMVYVGLSTLLRPDFLQSIIGEALPITSSYLIFVQATLPEIAFTLVVTSTLLAIMPGNYRQPLWRPPHA